MWLKLMIDELLGQCFMNNLLLDKLLVGICLVNEVYEIVYLNVFFFDCMLVELWGDVLGNFLVDVFFE